MVVYVPVVGNYFAQHPVVSGERVLLSPEPDNPVDSNAIQVVNLRGKKLGYVPKAQTHQYRQYIGSIGKIYPYKRGYRIRFL